MFYITCVVGRYTLKKYDGRKSTVVANAFGFMKCIGYAPEGSLIVDFTLKLPTEQELKQHFAVR